MRRLLICVMASACHATPATAVQPAVATPPPIPSNAVTVPLATLAAIALWDAAWGATRACLIPTALAAYDPRDALDLDLAIPRTFEEQDAHKACTKLAELAAAVPAGQTRLAAVVAQLAKTRAERTDGDLDPSRERLAALVRDLDDLSGAIHRTAGVPIVAVGTKRVPQGVYVSEPLVKTGGDQPVNVWLANNSIQRHSIAGHEVTFEDDRIEGTHFLGARMGGNSGVEAAGGSWYVWPEMRGDGHRGSREHMVVRRRDLPDVTVDDSANQQELRVIGEGAHRAIVYHSKRDRAWYVLVSDDGGATWARRATFPADTRFAEPADRHAVDLIVRDQAALSWVRVDEHANVAAPLAIAMPPQTYLEEMCVSGDMMWYAAAGSLRWIQRSSGRSGEVAMTTFSLYDGACAGDAVVGSFERHDENVDERGEVRCTTAGCSAPVTMTTLSDLNRYSAVDVTRTSFVAATFVGRIALLEQPGRPPRPIRMPDGGWPVAFAVWDDQPSVLVVDHHHTLRVLRAASRVR